MKVEINNENVNPFSGINFILEEFKNQGINRLVDKILGNRSANSEYSYSDVFKILCTIFFCGGDCAEDINTHLKPFLSGIPNIKIPSADTILNIQKELKTEKEIFKNDKGIENEINTNPILNELNIKMLLQLGLLKSGCTYDFDYDNQLVPTEKYDAKMSYKQKKGYFPGVSTINDMVVYFENHNGNTNVKFRQAETLKASYVLLAENGIKINRSRMDCGSYGKDIIEVVEKYSKLFYIRAKRSESLEDKIRDIKNWTKVEINNQKYEVASIEFTPLGLNKVYRLVIQKEPRKDLQINLFTGEAMHYRSILCNDWKNTEKDIIEYYNQRGTSEQTFDVMNNDFGWNKLPFSFMHENTVYMMFTAMCKNIYKYLIKKFSSKIKFLKENMRLKKFIFRFVTVAGKWIKRGRQNVLKLYTNNKYEILTT